MGWTLGSFWDKLNQSTPYAPVKQIASPWNQIKTKPKISKKGQKAHWYASSMHTRPSAPPSLFCTSLPVGSHHFTQSEQPRGENPALCRKHHSFIFWTWQCPFKSKEKSFTRFTRSLPVCILIYTQGEMMLTTATRLWQQSPQSHSLTSSLPCQPCYFTAESQHLTQLSAENILEQIHKMYMKDKWLTATELFIQMLLRESEYRDAE